MMLAAILVQLSVTTKAMAANLGDVVINEVAWAGTADNSNDEWIELYNPTNQNIDMSGWYFEDDGSKLPAFQNAQIAPHGYFLIEDSEETVSTIQADAILNFSLANAGDSLVLKDSSGKIIDQVNANGGAWYAGNGTDKSTMERIDPSKTSDQADNWASSLTGNGAKSRNAGDILGTPRSVNSNYGGSGVEVYFDPAEIFTASGEIIKVPVYVDNVTDLYAYGFEINYAPALLSFVSAKEADFLKSDGVSTAFNTALKDDEEGTLIVGNARLINPAKGLDGSGELFELTFKVVSPESDSGEMNFSGSSFLADANGDLPVKFKSTDINVAEEPAGVDSIANLKIGLGEEKYSLKLSWQEDLDGANSYIIKRKTPKGEFVKLAEISDAFFMDKDSVVGAGKLIPGVNYVYQVIAVKNNVQSIPLEITGAETRGIKGDNNRNAQVDGKDIENLARSYGSEYDDEEYNILTDTNYDGLIDGNDLIDIGVNFGLSE